ncbi:MAG: O-antigen ligase family protein, partial [Candidatus Omnitrophica bacterium]|nr:O-antigen ligase family protein [Candidatus Omnitrophota bacterium]
MSEIMKAFRILFASVSVIVVLSCLISLGALRQEMARMGAITGFIWLFVYGFRLRRKQSGGCVNPDVIFLVAISFLQTVHNIRFPYGIPVIYYELTYYVLATFVLWYGCSGSRVIDAGIVVWIVYSFRIFVARLTGTEFALLHIAALYLFLLWGEECAQEQGLSVRGIAIFVWFAAFIFIAAIASAHARCPFLSFSQVAVMTNFFCIAFLIANHTSQWRQVMLFLSAYWFLGVLILLLACRTLVQNPIYIKLLSLVPIRLGIGNRGMPPTIHPNSIAAFLAVVGAFAVGTISSMPRVLRIPVKGLIGIGMGIFVLTNSRLCAMSLVLAILFWLVFRSRVCHRHFRWPHKRGGMILLWIILLSLPFFIPHQVYIRWNDAWSNMSTLYSVQTSATVIYNHPWWGVGFDNYYILAQYAVSPSLVFPLLTVDIAQNLLRSAPHSLYVGIAFGAGIIGLIVFLGGLMSVISFLLRRYSQEEEKSVRRLLGALIVAFTVIILHGVFSMTFHLTILPAFFWVMIGVMVAVVYLRVPRVWYPWHPFFRKTFVITLGSIAFLAL